MQKFRMGFIVRIGSQGVPLPPNPVGCPRENSWLRDLSPGRIVRVRYGTSI